MSGNLVIKPLKATLTRDVDFFSKMDPYCVIYVGQQKFTTSVAQGQGKNPTWCNEFAARRTNEDSIKIEVWDYDSGSKNDYIADGTYPLIQVLGKVGSHTEWINLNYKGKGAGQIMIEFNFKPDNPMMPMQQPLQQPPIQQFQQPPMQQQFQQPPMQQQFQQPYPQQPYPQQPFQQPMQQPYQQPMQQPFQQPQMMPPQQPFMQPQQGMGLPAYGQPMMPQQQFVQPQAMGMGLPAFGNPMMMMANCNMMIYQHYKPPVNAHGYKPLALITFRHDCHKCHGSGNSKGYPCKKCYHHFGYCKKCCGTHYEIKSGHKCSKC